MKIINFLNAFLSSSTIFVCYSSVVRVKVAFIHLPCFCFIAVCNGEMPSDGCRMTKSPNMMARFLWFLKWIFFLCVDYDCRWRASRAVGFASKLDGNWCNIVMPVNFFCFHVGQKGALNIRAFVFYLVNSFISWRLCITGYDRKNKIYDQSEFQESLIYASGGL